MSNLQTLQLPRTTSDADPLTSSSSQAASASDLPSPPGHAPVIYTPDDVQKVVDAIKGKASWERELDQEEMSRIKEEKDRLEAEVQRVKMENDELRGAKTNSISSS